LSRGDARLAFRCEVRSAPLLRAVDGLGGKRPKELPKFAVEGFDLLAQINRAPELLGRDGNAANLHGRNHLQRY
jgi:hypothetical protein